MGIFGSCNSWDGEYRESDDEPLFSLYFIAKCEAVMEVVTKQLHCLSFVGKELLKDGDDG
jgi:hypothetical protein